MEFLKLIPDKTRDYILTDFLFKDIISAPHFQSFLSAGKQIDNNFCYELSFGFIPRCYQPTAQDRYMIEEDNDCTEIYFILEGSWAIAFDSHTKTDQETKESLP